MLENESINRIQDLRKVAKTFFEKSLACTKIADVKSFFDLAQQANASADELENNTRIESCWTYLHFVRFFGYSPDYNNYLEFCARNRFSPVAKTDLTHALSYQGTDMKSADTIKINAVQ